MVLNKIFFLCVLGSHCHVNSQNWLKFLVVGRDVGVSKSLKVTELRPRQSVVEPDEMRGTPLNR